MLANTALLLHFVRIDLPLTRAQLTYGSRRVSLFQVGTSTETLRRLMGKARELESIAQMPVLVTEAGDRAEMTDMVRSVASNLEGGVAKLVELAAMAVDSNDYAGAEIQLLEALNASVSAIPSTFEAHVHCMVAERCLFFEPPPMCYCSRYS
jgi:hypothetical protein